jgi:hypothetical protein
MMNLYDEESDGNLTITGLNEAGHVLDESEQPKIRIDSIYLDE